VFFIRVPLMSYQLIIFHVVFEFCVSFDETEHFTVILYTQGPSEICFLRFDPRWRMLSFAN